MMDRCAFLVSTGAVLLAAPLTADAQPERKRPRIALLFINTPLADMMGPQPPSDDVKVFLDGMRALGWRDGENIAIERRSAERQPDRPAGLVQELVGLRVDLVVVSSVAVVKMIKQASDTMPVVLGGKRAAPTRWSGRDSLPLSLDRVGQ